MSRPPLPRPGGRLNADGFGWRWEGKKPSETCPAIGCSGTREARAVLEWDGDRRVETACIRHIGFYVSRAVSRMIVLRGGRDALRELVDDEPFTFLTNRDPGDET